MSKHRLPVTESQSGQTAWQLSWEGTAYLFISAALGGIAWLGIQAPLAQGFKTLGLFGVFAALVITAQRSLACTPVPRDWTYRLSFFAGCGLACIRWITLLFLPVQSANPLWLLAPVAGSFLGGVWISGLNEQWWENNSPPPADVQKEVLRRHRERIGVPGRMPLSKRFFDVSLAILGLTFSAPVWMLSAFLVWIEDPGPILFVKNSVGKGGINFRQFKFRTMVRQAENNTGPILASKQDERVLWFGWFLRKTALDELPQLINILLGEMSFVGPRPQRTVLVSGYLEKIPEYAERHRVLPGLAGLAQVAGDYYLTPRQKLRFDRLYIRYSSLAYDLKLLLLAFLITFWYRWQGEWNGKLPRRLLRFGVIRFERKPRRSTRSG